jgi:hypothetical protein
MNNPLRRILMPAVVVAVAFGPLVGLAILIRAICNLAVLGGLEILLWIASIAVALVVAFLAERIPSRVPWKVFLLGSVAPAVFFGCALFGYWVRTGTPPQPSMSDVCFMLAMSFGIGLAFHIAASKDKRSPSNTSLERTREG